MYGLYEPGMFMGAPMFPPPMAWMGPSSPMAAPWVYPQYELPQTHMAPEGLPSNPSAPVKPKPAKAKKKAKGPRIPGLAMPGGLSAGTAVLWPQSWCYIHVIPRGTSFEALQTSQFSYVPFKTPSNISGNELIEQIGGGENITVTEVFQLGNGQWGKGETIKYDTDRANKAIAEFGWGPPRGASSKNPVWLTVGKSS